MAVMKRATREVMEKRKKAKRFQAKFNLKTKGTQVSGIKSNFADKAIKEMSKQR